MELKEAKYWLRPCIIRNDDLIRLGTLGDGGYVLSKNALKKTDAVIAIGIKDDWKFESDFLKANKNSILLAFDLVTDIMFFIKCTIDSFLKLQLKKGFFYFFNIFNYLLFFRFNKKVKYTKKGVSGNKVGFLSLREIVNTIETSRKNILMKIDIEGDEYSLLEDIIFYQDRIHMICIEFHNIISDNYTFSNFIDSLSSYYSVIHIHMNNNSKFDKELNISDVIEVTLANNNCYVLEKTNSPFIGPTKLDYPCNPLLEEISFKL